MRKIQRSILLFVCTMSAFGQKQTLTLRKQVFELHNVTGSVIKFKGKDVLKIERDLNDALPLQTIFADFRIELTRQMRIN
jgi:hypothetical protein